MALVFIFISLLLGMSDALPQDLSGKMLVFPQETKTDHVTLITSRQNLRVTTVCLRYFTDLSRECPLFTVATHSQENDFIIYKNARDEMEFYVRGDYAAFKGLDNQLNKWHSVCGTWDAASGLVQLWVNGKHSSIKFVTNSIINEPMSIVLGQEQDSFGGGFSSSQSFVGMIRDVHMWDKILSPCEIRYYSNELSFPPGNILSWNSIEFQLTGRVLIKDVADQC
uniref:Pentraxin family member n=2 Tax=Boleophthalmus pectinirostris TaxID=150288 RepID=A0A5J6BA72_BOLPE|nr:SAP [Boleophthalmus pectinirostris]